MHLPFTFNGKTGSNQPFLPIVLPTNFSCKLDSWTPISLSYFGIQRFLFCIIFQNFCFMALSQIVSWQLPGRDCNSVPCVLSFVKHHVSVLKKSDLVIFSYFPKLQTVLTVLQSYFYVRGILSWISSSQSRLE